MTLYVNTLKRTLSGTPYNLGSIVDQDDYDLELIRLPTKAELVRLEAHLDTNDNYTEETIGLERAIIYGDDLFEEDNRHPLEHLGIDSNDPRTCINRKRA